MKVAVLSESPADEAAIRVLVEGVLGESPQRVDLPLIRTRGWHGALGAFPAALTQLHYTTDTEAFVVVVDSDQSPVHQLSHEQPGGAAGKCRVCNLRETAIRVQSQLRARASRPPIKTAFGQVGIETGCLWNRSSASSVDDRTRYSRSSKTSV